MKTALGIVAFVTGGCLAVLIAVACQHFSDPVAPDVSFSDTATIPGMVVIILCDVRPFSMWAAHRDSLDWTTYAGATPTPIDATARVLVPRGVFMFYESTPPREVR